MHAADDLMAVRLVFTRVSNQSREFDFFLFHVTDLTELVEDLHPIKVLSAEPHPTLSLSIFPLMRVQTATILALHTILLVSAQDDISEDGDPNISTPYVVALQMSSTTI
jgi:hypothetical protein